MPPKKKQKKTGGSGEVDPSSGDAPVKLDTKSKKLLDKLYGISIPEDLIHFWDLCCDMNKKNPIESLSSLHLKLVGPFEILAKKIDAKSLENPLRLHLHWRFFYDPPEFLTVLVSDNPGENPFHLGYLKDDPGDTSSIVVSNSGDNCKLNILGDNIFAAVYCEIEQKLKSAKGKEKTNLQNLSKKICEYAKSLKLSMEKQSPGVKARSAKVVSKSFHGAGIVVPIDENEVGYRPLHETDAKLKKMFERIDKAENNDLRMIHFDELQEMITYIQFANDECDYGMGYELGMDMFCYGSRYLNKAANRLLSGAYGLLKRDLYQKIVEQHIADRRKDNYARLP